jgi:hypothetical protein
MLHVISRTYNEDASGTYGQLVPARRWYDAACASNYSSCGNPHTLFHIAKSDDFRTNVGFVEVLGIDAELELEMIDNRGLIGSGTVHLPASSHLQINDIFDYLGAPASDAAIINVTVGDFSRVFSYASVVDSWSSDPIYVAGQSPVDADGYLVVPAAASSWGSYGSRWQTDLHAQPVWEDAESVEITFVPGDGSSPVSKTYYFEGDPLHIPDVVSDLGGNGSGALILEADGFILASSRTYNQTDSGTLGQLIPALDSYSRIKQATILGAERSSEYRTNIGIYNAHYLSAEVLVRLVSERGALLGSKTWQVEPRRHLQINDIFFALKVPDQRNCRVDLIVQDIGLPSIYAYGSVIDNRSGDSILSPAMGMRELATNIELSNRDNAFLIDELTEAKGVEQLPAGTTTATVTGTGDLGRPELPIQVLCLYKSPAGELQSAVLPIGGSISDIGGERFWCVIPDWISKRDNTGAVTVTLTGGAEEVRLELDARDNAVLLDRLQASVTSTRPPAETYRVEIDGDLGRAELPPQLVVMYRDAGTGELRVAAPGNGELIGPIETDFQILGVVLDWIQRDDNTGRSALVPACTMHVGSCGAYINGSITGSDCESSPRGPGFYGERTKFRRIAGQQVTIDLTLAGEYSFGYLDLVAPSGTVIASTSYSGNRSLIEGVILPETGMYTIWVTSGMYGWSSYTLRIHCLSGSLTLAAAAKTVLNGELIVGPPYQASFPTTLPPQLRPGKPKLRIPGPNVQEQETKPATAPATA